MRRFTVAATLMLAWLPLASSARAETGVTDTKILIGASQSLTGPVAFTGGQQIAGMEAYMEAVNAQGGVNGRRLEWKWYDDAFKPQDAVANVKRMVEQDGVFLLISAIGTAVSKAPVPYLEEKKVPFLFPFQGDPGMAAHKYVFTSLPFYDYQARLIARYLVEKRGLKRIGVIYQDDVVGQLFLENLRKELKPLNLDVVASEPMRRGNMDATAQVAKLAASNLDGCLLSLVPGQAAQVLKEAAKVGWKKVKFIGDPQNTDESLLHLAGSEGEGLLGFTPWPDPVHSQLSGMKKYREILAKYQPKVTPNRSNLYGYFYAMLMVEGLKGAGKNLTRETFMRSMESIKGWESGIVPAVSFSPTDHHTQSNLMAVEAKGGVFVPASGWIALRDGKLIETPLGK